MWAAAAGSLSANKRPRLNSFPELSETKIITWKLHVFKNTMKYNQIIG